MVHMPADIDAYKLTMKGVDDMALIMFFSRSGSIVE